MKIALTLFDTSFYPCKSSTLSFPNLCLNFWHLLVPDLILSLFLLKKSSVKVSLKSFFDVFLASKSTEHKMKVFGHFLCLQSMITQIKGFTLMYCAFWCTKTRWTSLHDASYNWNKYWQNNVGRPRWFKKKWHQNFG